VEVPDDFYSRVAARHDRAAAAEPAQKIQVSRELPATKLRVYEDKRKRSFRATVLAVEGGAVVLDQTYFYPEGGGQEPDHGTIADQEVYDVQKVGSSILHFIRGDAGPLVKKRVACVIDAERREALMRNHTATHIVLGAARKALGNHVWQAGAHKGQDLARLDITHYDALTDTEVARIEELANAEVLGHHQVRAKVMARDVAEKKFGFRLYQGGSVPGGELRVVEIPKWDAEACGGTHVSRTSDVSLIKILRSTRIQDGVVRLEYVAGKGALESIRKMADDLRRTAEILAVPADQVVPAAERLVAEWKEFRKLSQRATEEQATAKTREELATAKGSWPIIKDEVSQGVGFMISMSKATASESRATGVYWAKAPNDVKLVVTRGKDVPIDVADLVRTVAPEFHGKGGGKADFAEASFPNLDQARAAAMKLEELIRKKLGIASG
jgi:alanyl-tRNA synthetase